MTYSDLARTNEAQEARVLDEELMERDREEWRECPFGVGEMCRSCPAHIKARCEE